MHNDQFDLSHIKNFITTTRTSTTNDIDQFSQLENAIQQGDIDLAVRMLKRTKSFLENTNDRGETPLLIAAKCNQNKLIIAILKKHSKYAEQVDQKGNNLIHLLANIPENEAATTIDNVFVLLDEQLKEQLMLGRNQFGQTPDDIARRRGNMKYINMFSRQISSSDSN
jgi:ankyrin repeat protein